MHTYDVNDLPGFVRRVDSLFERWDADPGDLWFRGVSALGYKPVPGVVWRKVDDEESIVTEFLISYRGLFEGQVQDPWEQYALMQHYGLPTRLLDWTISPLLGLYFAVSGKSAPTATRAVWVLDPYELNNRAVGDSVIPLAGRATAKEFADLNNYLPCPLRPKSQAKPPRPALAIDVPFSNRRIVAQQGCFTVHGASPSPIDEQLSSGGRTRNHLALFRIRGKSRAEMLLEELRRFGFRDEIVFPDLPALSARLVRERC